MPRRGLEPPQLSLLVPETSASTNSATWAGTGPCLRTLAQPLSMRDCLKNLLPVEFMKILRFLALIARFLIINFSLLKNITGLGHWSTC